jgi:hypothetical protein
MPDLDLIKQAEQGCGQFGKADPSISSGSAKTATNAWRFAARAANSQRRPPRSSNLIKEKKTFKRDPRTGGDG